uniref:Uncharacterized protein n=1 Tax=Arundo donax TaxID=35708 RepID=A0A0A9GKU1_ARUDO
MQLQSCSGFFSVLLVLIFVVLNAQLATVPLTAAFAVRFGPFL